MAKFYGVISGQAKTHATRRGSASSGLTVTAASDDAGAVTVELTERNGVTWALVTRKPWSYGASGDAKHATLYNGPLAKMGEHS